MPATALASNTVTCGRHILWTSPNAISVRDAYGEYVAPMPVDAACVIQGTDVLVDVRVDIVRLPLGTAVRLPFMADLPVYANGEVIGELAQVAKSRRSM